ncbi:hypothetical protein MMC20_007497 [Loxospora ochrophaea]|nr:hypothetical protein [Loxospora ochrophaea]
MVRSSSLDLESPEITSINLARALSRLEQKVLSPNPSPRLLHSSYERTKTAANLDYARTLLLRLEHTKPTHGRKAPHNTTPSVQQSRLLIKRLNDRLSELSQQKQDSYSSASSEDEDLLGEDPSRQPTQPQPEQPLNIGNPAISTTSQPPPSSPQPPPLTSTLRNRFPPSSPQPPASSHPSTLLTHNSTQTASLTTSLLTMATALKASTQSFSASLDAEKPLLGRASEGLERNATGMAAAEKRMGMLRRMSEGRGWWGRMVMYAWIAGLWVLAVLLVFVGPKMRF